MYTACNEGPDLPFFVHSREIVKEIVAALVDCHSDAAGGAEDHASDIRNACPVVRVLDFMPDVARRVESQSNARAETIAQPNVARLAIGVGRPDVLVLKNRYTSAEPQFPRLRPKGVSEENEQYRQKPLHASSLRLAFRLGNSAACRPHSNPWPSLLLR